MCPIIIIGHFFVCVSWKALFRGGAIINLPIIARLLRRPCIIYDPSCSAASRIIRSVVSQSIQASVTETPYFNPDKSLGIF